MSALLFHLRGFSMSLLLMDPTAANKHTVSLVISCQIASLVLLTHSD